MDREGLATHRQTLPDRDAARARDPRHVRPRRQNLQRALQFLQSTHHREVGVPVRHQVIDEALEAVEGDPFRRRCRSIQLATPLEPAKETFPPLGILRNGMRDGAPMPSTVPGASSSPVSTKPRLPIAVWAALTLLSPRRSLSRRALPPVNPTRPSFRAAQYRWVSASRGAAPGRLK